MKNNLKLLSGVMAFVVYFGLLGLLFNYFNHHSKTKPIHYVEKNENRIAVSVSSPSSKRAVEKISERKTKPKPKKEKVIKKEKEPEPPKPKEVDEPKENSKKVKIVKKEIKKEIKLEPPKPKEIDKPKEKQQEKKKVKVSNLFDKINEKQPEKPKETKSVSDDIRKPEERDNGIENAYFAKVEKILQNWPSQSEFAGETVKVWLKLYSNGTFEFRVLSASNNQDFNNGLVQYLQQLQKIGFEPHQNSKPYELNVEFVAKE